jgi:hypothetical protein
MVVGIEIEAQLLVVGADVEVVGVLVGAPEEYIVGAPVGGGPS